MVWFFFYSSLLLGPSVKFCHFKKYNSYTSEAPTRVDLTLILPYMYCSVSPPISFLKSIIYSLAKLILNLQRWSANLNLSDHSHAWTPSDKAHLALWPCLLEFLWTSSIFTHSLPYGLIFGRELGSVLITLPPHTLDSQPTVLTGTNKCSMTFWREVRPKLNWKWPRNL